MAEDSSHRITGPAAGDMTLLLVDDDSPFRQRLARAMEKRGFAVTDVESVAEGLDAAQNGQPPAYAVVDLRLADGSGLDVVEALRTARTCWDHLAGRLGVALHDGLVARGVLRPAPGGWETTAAGDAWLERFGVDLDAARRARRFACDCMDWSERRPHLGGGLARAICTLCLARGWVRRQPGEGLARRVVASTPEGARVLREAFGVRLEDEAA